MDHFQSGSKASLLVLLTEGEQRNWEHTLEDSHVANTHSGLPA